MLAQTTMSLLCLSTLAFSAALPSKRCSETTYPIADHVVSIYPPSDPFNGFYSADVKVGESQTFRAVLDTGSSDTWFLAAEAICYDTQTSQILPPDQCDYVGPRYTPDAAFELIPGVNHNESYGNGEIISGPLGYTKLTFGGLTVPKQEISATTYAAGAGVPKGDLSGLLGLAYPNATNAYPGTDPSKDVLCLTNLSYCPISYSPFITTLFSENLTEPLFAFALSRSETNGGVMTLGGIPPLDDPIVQAVDGVSATVPIETYQNTSTHQLYALSVKGFHYANASHQAGQGQYIVDTGTISNVIPAAESDAINALFDPPAFHNKTLGAYTVLCNATAPRVGVDIGGQTFYHNPRDLIIPSTYSYPLCMSAVGPSPADKYILGATFLKNVLAVFDVGGSELTFMSRMYYEDT